MTTLGSRIRQIRTGLGASQRQFAALVGVDTDDTISRWELNKQRPGDDQLERIADLGNVSLGWLYGGEATNGDDEEGEGDAAAASPYVLVSRRLDRLERQLSEIRELLRALESH